MGKNYCKEMDVEGKPTTSEDMRIFCQRPGKTNEDGTPLYFTEQSHKRECDVNYIIQKYDKTGLISHISRFEGKFGDMTGLEFKAIQDKIANAQSMFNALPSEVRNKFNNDPSALLSFMDDPENRDEAIELGLIRNTWTEETDGLGEHVKLGENIKKADPTENIE